MHKIWLRRTLIIISILTVTYLLAPFFLTSFARTLIRVEPINQADVIISLSGDPYCARELQAARLYQQGLAPLVAASGQAYGAALENHVAAKGYLLSLGLPETAVQQIYSGENTRQEAQHIQAFMHAHNFRSAIIVTAAFHSRRALFTLEKTAPELKFYSLPVPTAGAEWQPENWWKQRLAAGITVRESLAWGNTLITRWQ